MGNAALDSGQQDAYNLIRWIPGAGQVYSATRAIVYPSKGDDQDAIDSLFAIFGPAGSSIRTIRDSGAFDEHDVHTKGWVGDKRSAYNIPEDYFQGHLFDTSKFLYLFNDVPSDMFFLRYLTICSTSCSVMVASYNTIIMYGLFDINPNDSMHPNASYYYLDELIVKFQSCNFSTCHHNLQSIYNMYYLF